MNGMTADILLEMKENFGPNWTYLLAQLAPFLIAGLLFVLASNAILRRGRGWEVPVWLLLSLFVPVIFPILAMIHFRKRKSPPVLPAQG